MPDQSTIIPRSSMPLMPALVGFYFAARLCITFLFFQSDPKTGAYVNFAIHFALFLAVLLYSFGPAANSMPAMFSARPLRWILAFLAIGLFSLAWSATISKPVAFASVNLRRALPTVAHAIGPGLSMAAQSVGLGPRRVFPRRSCGRRRGAS